MTSCMSSMRSNQLSYASVTDDIIAYYISLVKSFLKVFYLFYGFFVHLKEGTPPLAFASLKGVDFFCIM